MIADQQTSFREAEGPCAAKGLPESFATAASPAIRALAAEWIVSSRAYFGAMDRWGRTSNAKPDRNQVETECDLAIMEDEAVRRRIIDLPAAEPGVLALKAAVFLTHLPGLDQVDMLVGDVVGDEGPSAEALALTIARDVVSMLGPSVRALADAAKPERQP